MSSPAPVYLVSGDDAGLVSQALSALLAEVADDAVVEEHGVSSRDEPLAIGAVLDACTTPPMFSGRRVVVVRDAALLDAAQAKALAAYLAEPLETTVLVLAAVLTSPSGSRRSVAAALLTAVKKVGRLLDVSPGSGRARSQWISDRIASSGLHLDPAAASRLAEHLGEDLGRLDGTLANLVAAYGERARVRLDDLEPFLGTKGAAAPWDLTDAIDSGDSTAAIGVLHRLLAAGERQPIQVLAGLHRHYAAMLRLDGVEDLDEAAAASLTGLRPFPAKKALAQSRRLGYGGLVDAVSLVARADLDLRGVSGLPGEVVLEILVARLTRQNRRRAGIAATTAAGPVAGARRRPARAAR